MRVLSGTGRCSQNKQTRIMFRTVHGLRGSFRQHACLPSPPPPPPMSHIPSVCMSRLASYWVRVKFTYLRLIWHVFEACLVRFTFHVFQPATSLRIYLMPSVLLAMFVLVLVLHACPLLFRRVAAHAPIVRSLARVTRLFCFVPFGFSVLDWLARWIGSPAAPSRRRTAAPGSVSGHG